MKLFYEYYTEAKLDNVLDRSFYWLDWSSLEMISECFAWNEI